jgi:carbamoyltransferase
MSSTYYTSTPREEDMSQRSQIIVGINCAHDASACLVIDGEIKVAVMEERLSRKKHQEGLPKQAIDYCLGVCGVTDINDVDCIVMNQYNKSAYEVELQHMGYSNHLIINPSHHLLHAYYAYFASGFDDAAVLIVDGSGYNYGEYIIRDSPLLGPAPEFSEMEEAETIFFVRKGNITLVDKRWGLWHSSEPYYRFPSLGHMFTIASQYIFDAWIEAGKTMGLAPYGDSNALPFKIIGKTDKGLTVDVDWILKFPNPTHDLPVHQVKLKCDIAAKVQAELEDAMLYLARRAYDATQSSNLCLAGGVALNSVANGRIIRESPFRNVFIAPAANDGGISIGAALYGYHHMNMTPPVYRHDTDFHGRTYNESDILSIIQNNPRIRYERTENSAERAATEIAAGKIIGWFEGKSELGPRALGHRSILCDPRQPDMKDQLNNRVKFREGFRPYAASVLEEHVAEYFDLDCKNRYMLVVVSIRPEKRKIIPAVCHVDSTCRIQTVEAQYEGNYRHLIEHFYSLTSVPLVLNTSLNVRGEPIAETPQDALACFLGSGMDILYLGPYRISKVMLDEGDGENRLPYLIPYLNENLALSTETRAINGKWADCHTVVQTRTGYRLPVEASLLRLLELIDGQSNCNILLQNVNRTLTIPWSTARFLAQLRVLQDCGTISFVWSDV